MHTGNRDARQQREMGLPRQEHAHWRHRAELLTMPSREAFSEEGTFVLSVLASFQLWEPLCWTLG